MEVMVNWTKIQVSLLLIGRTSNKYPLQYHQMSDLATVRVVLLVTSSKYEPSLHLDIFPRNSTSSSYSTHREA
jgi:hypothetical protein